MTEHDETVMFGVPTCRILDILLRVVSGGLLNVWDRWLPGVRGHSGVFHGSISAGMRYLGLLLFNMRLRNKIKTIRDMGQTFGLPNSAVWEIIKKQEQAL